MLGVLGCVVASDGGTGYGLFCFLLALSCHRLAIVYDLLYDLSLGNILTEDNLARLCGEIERLLVEIFLKSLLEQSE